MKVNYLAISTRSHLPYVAMMAESLKKTQKDAELTCLLVEKDHTEKDCYKNLYDIVPVLDLNVDYIYKLLFQYDPMEICCALKPYFILHQMENVKADVFVYLDSDIYIYNSLQPEIINCLSQSSVALTPHLLSHDCQKEYRTISISGVYNAGFIAVRNNNNAKVMLEWWKEQVKNDCISDPYGGVLWDQRWLDLAVGFFSHIRILRAPGFNIAHWNLHERIVVKKENNLFVNDDYKLYFIHYSGLDDTSFSRYMSDENSLTEIIEELAAEYRKELFNIINELDYRGEYTFGNFSDGTKVTNVMREIVRLGKVNISNPYIGKDEINSSVPRDKNFILLNRPSYLVENGVTWYLKLKRLWNHPVIGVVWKFWRKWINKDL